jgi:hypothetical protein
MLLHGGAAEPHPGFGFRWVGLLLSLLTISASEATTIELRPVADTTLIETAPAANLGGHRFMNSGSTGLSPATRNRALLKFDLVNHVPATATIVSVELVLEVVGQPRDGGVEGIFELHRMLQSWGEGEQVGAVASPGLGEPAAAAEATWTHRFALTGLEWGAPGGLVATDFAGHISAEQIVYGVGDSPYLFGSTGSLIADIEFWLRQPEKNFGWMLKGADEGVRFTARRFGAREDPVNAPILRIQYEAGPSLLIEKTGNNVEVLVPVEPAKVYAIEFRAESEAGAWTTLTNVGPFSESRTATVLDARSEPRRFYRARVRSVAP